MRIVQQATPMAAQYLLIGSVGSLKPDACQPWAGPPVAENLKPSARKAFRMGSSESMDGAETEPNGEQSDRGMKRILIVLTVFSILGLLLGGTGLTIGFRANKELIQFRKEVNSRPDPAQELKTKVESLEKRLVKVGAETVRINNNLAALHDQTQRAFDDVSRQGRAAREKLNEISNRIADSSDTKAGPTAAEVAVTSSPEATETGNGASAEIPPDGYHAIQPGDNFGKLAVRYGSTVAEFMAANPAVAPRRLQIGQKIKIP